MKAANLELEKADLLKQVESLDQQYHDTVEKLWVSNIAKNELETEYAWELDKNALLNTQVNQKDF